MDAIDHLSIGMSAEMTLVVSKEMTIRHFVAGLP